MTKDNMSRARAAPVAAGRFSYNSGILPEVFDMPRL